MRVKVLYSLKEEIHEGAGEIVDYNKTLTSPPGTFTSLEEIQAYMEVFEQKRLDLEMKKYGQKLIYPPQEQPRHEAIIKAK